MVYEGTGDSNPLVIRKSTSKLQDGEQQFSKSSSQDNESQNASIAMPSQSSFGMVESLSRILPSTSFAGFADVVELDVMQRLSMSRLNPEDIIEIVKSQDVAKYRSAIDIVEKSQPTCGKSHFAFAPIEQLMEELGLHDLNHGLTPSQITLNREMHGYNILDVGKTDPIWKIYLNQFYSFVIILLFAAALASFILNNTVEGAFILLIMNINAALATYMEKSAANVLEKLAKISSPNTTVVRNGIVSVLDSKELVPGDVVILKTGDTVSADLRLFEIMELRINESLLTGESEDIKKTIEAVDLDSPFSSNLCFASTSVTSGSAKAIVINTGMNTQVGKIAKHLKKASEGPKITPLQRGLNKLGGIIGIISACVLVCIVVVAVVTGFDDPTRPNSNRTLSIVLLAVGFAASSIPEGLPMVVTISLSLGAKDMAAQNANIRKLPAVETLGCCSIICTDKTGTLTEGKMTATTIVTFRNGPSGFSAHKHLFYPTHGFSPIGGVFNPDDLTPEYKNELSRLSGDPGSFDLIDNNIVRPDSTTIDSKHIKTCMLTAYLNSHGTTLTKYPDTDRWTSIGCMSESPLIVAASKCGIGTALNPHDETHKNYPRLEHLEVPFSSVRKMMCTVHKLTSADVFGDLNLARPDGKRFTHVATMKGAPDILAPLCKLVVSAESSNFLIDWSLLSTGLLNNKDAIDAPNFELSSQALRVLLLALCPLTDDDISALSKCEDSDERLSYVIGGANSPGLPILLLGFVGSIDPPRHGVREAIATCERAGVRVIMITGDQTTTASAIAKDIGLIKNVDDDAETAIECSKLHISESHFNTYLPDYQLDEMTTKYSVFCRAQPEDKVAIVESLKRQGYLTAMTGDGVNDAAALKAADIGISMGINGTDVAKGASEMVLLDDDFCTIVSAIESGRTIYANIQKFVSFLLGTNIGEILYLTISILISTLPPVEALQILFLNFMTDGCPAVAISREPPDDDVMSKKPRPPNQPIMTRDWWIFGNIPHTIFEALVVVSSIIIGLYCCTGVFTLNSLYNQCKHVTLRDANNFEHKLVYFCKSYEYRFTTNYRGWVTNINYYDPAEMKMKTVLGAAKGRLENIRPNTPGLYPSIYEGFHALTTGIPEPLRGNVEYDDNGWLKSVESQVFVDGGKLYGAAPPGFYDITGRKTMQARTLSFITAVWCEMLRAYTVRSWDYFYRVFNRNPWMHVACSISATSTIAITIIPSISEIMHTTSLTWWQLLIAIGLALISMILDECIPKTICRRMGRHLA